MYEATAVAPRSLALTLRGFHELTKPGITLFVGITAVAGYMLSAGGHAEPATLILVMLATMLMSGGAATLNQVNERQRDARMGRTVRRPIPAGVITPRNATIFGWALSCAGVLLATLTLPWLVLGFLALCHVTYLYLYTPLKPITPLCTLAGAIPGALPVLAGSAATGSMPTLAAFALTGLLFTWQIPHFMAIGWLMREDYRRAGFEMLPVIDSAGATTGRVSFLYAVATMGFAVLVTRYADVSVPWLATVHTAGMCYMLATLPFLRTRSTRQAKRLFFASLVVLPVMLIALMLNFVL